MSAHTHVPDSGRPAWAERAAQELARAGYRRGGARHAVVALLAEQHCALSVAEIMDLLAQRDRSVARASAYRVLEELEQLALVQRVEVGAGIVRYEATGAGAGHHHHLVCERCGRLEPFSDDGLERAILRLSSRLPLEVSDHEIVIRGSCAPCAAVSRR
ncbi:MAG TPA: Fur family transcriptional regulator [Solirubrobacteraceae bacterium]